MLEPKAKKKSGIVAFALGLSATFACAGGLFSVMDNTALAQVNFSRPQTEGLSTQPGAAVAPGTVVPQPGPTQDMIARKNQLLFKARQDLAAGDIVNAEKLVQEVRSMNLQYTEKEDQPAYIGQLIADYKNVVEKIRTEGNSEMNRRLYADVLTRQALGLMLKGDLDAAEKLAHAADSQGVMFSPQAIQSKCDPKSILAQIQDTRILRRSHENVIQTTSNPQISLAVQKQMEQAGQILAQGRTALASGNTEQAEKFCREAMSLGIPDSQYPQGLDTPGRLQRDIAAFRLQGNGNVALAGTQAPVNPNATLARYNSNADNTRMRQVNGTVDAGLADLNLAAPIAPPVAPAQQGMAAPLQYPGASDLLNQADRQGINTAEQTTAEMTRDISAAYRIRNEKPDEALNILFQTRARIENSDLDPMVKQQNLRQIDFSIEATKRFVETNRPQIEVKEQNTRILEEIKERRDDKAFVDQKLKELCEQINQCLDEGRHEDAMYLASKANELAPEHPTVKLLYTTTRMQHEIRLDQEIQKLKQEGFAGAMLAVDKTSIPVLGDNPMLIDRNRRNQARGRSGTEELIGSARTDAEMEILKKMNMPVRLDFDDQIPLGEVLQHLQGYTGIPIMPDYQALKEVEVSTDQLIRVQLPNDISLKSALNLVLGQLNLSYVVEDDVLKITTPARSKGRMYKKTYYVGDLVIPIQNFNGAGPHTFESSFNRAMQTTLGMNQNNGFNNVAPNSFANLGASAPNAMVDPAIMAQINPSGTTPLNHNGNNVPLGGGGGGSMADFGPIIDLIETVTGDTESWGDGAQVMEYANNLSLVIRQTEDVHAEIADLLKQLRKLNDLQVTVEVRFITLSDSFFERMGVDFDLNFTNKGSASKVKTQSITDPDGNTTTKMSGDKVVVGMSSPGLFTANLDVPMTQDSYSKGIPVFGGFAADAGTSLGFAILSDIEAFFFMNAAQGDTRSNILQAPKITLFNGQMGSINDFSQTPFVTSVVPVVADFSAAYQPVIVILNEGTNMTVQAVVSSDRQYVRLTVNPVFSKITNKTNTFRYSGDETATTDKTSKTKGDSENPASSDEKEGNDKTSVVRSGVTVQQPVIASVNVSTTVSVPDGGTILLGGIKRLSEGRNENGTPILNKIPFINRLFMNTAIGRETQSIMMMVTPRILIQEEEEEYMAGTSP